MCLEIVVRKTGLNIIGLGYWNLKSRNVNDALIIINKLVELGF